VNDDLISRIMNRATKSLHWRVSVGVEERRDYDRNTYKEKDNVAAVGTNWADLPTIEVTHTL
jgi:hypothetical protein